jgi:hypothetical protein
MFQTKLVRKIKSHFVINIFFLSEVRAVYDIMWKNTAEPDTPQMTIWRKRIAFSIPKATGTPPQYVTLIAFSLQQRLHELVSLLIM